MVGRTRCTGRDRGERRRPIAHARGRADRRRPGPARLRRGIGARRTPARKSIARGTARHAGRLGRRGCRAEGPTQTASASTSSGLVPAQADVFGRADLSVAIASRALPSGTTPSRLVLDVMVAPDGAGEKAVVSAFVNERLLASTVAAIGEPTRLDFPLPDGLVGTVANVRAVVQRRSAQGDCRFEPQGYPAQILGSSAVVLASRGRGGATISPISRRMWANGIEILLPASAAARPLTVLPLLADVLSALSPETAPITVKLRRRRSRRRRPRRSSRSATCRRQARRRACASIAAASRSPTAPAARCSISAASPPARWRRSSPPARNPDLWIKPLRSDGALPAPPIFARSRRRRLPRQDRRRARAVDRARHAGAHLLSRPGVVADDRRALPRLDHRRPVGARHHRLPVRAAADAIAAAAPPRRANSLLMQPLSPSDRALGDLLVARHVLTLPQLDEAVRLAETWHVRLGDAMLSRNWTDAGGLLPGRRLPLRPAVRRSDRASRPIPRCCVAEDADIYARTLTMPWRRRDGRLADRDRRARPGNRAVRAPALGHRNRVRRRVEVRHRLGGADRVRPMRCRTAPCSSSPSAIPRCRRSTVFTPAQVVFGYRAADASAGSASRSRRSPR